MHKWKVVQEILVSGHCTSESIELFIEDEAFSPSSDMAPPSKLRSHCRHHARSVTCTQQD
jgi:hypothetical protein